MSVLKKNKVEAVGLIEWQNDSNNTVVWCFPRFHKEIQMGTKLVVREFQVAIFFHKGTMADVFGPGEYRLQVKEMPLLANLKMWDEGFTGHFKADIYFINTCQFNDQKWITKKFFIISDQRFGMTEARVSGNYSFKVTDAHLFMKKISHTDSFFAIGKISSHLRNLLVAKFTDAIGESNFPIEKFISCYEELSEIGIKKLNPFFSTLGITITQFVVEKVSMPEKVKIEILENSIHKIDQQKLLAEAKITADKSTPANSSVAAESMVNKMSEMLDITRTVTSIAPPPLPLQQFYVAINNKSAGPFALDQLGSLVENGSLKRETLVWTSGLVNWVPAGSIAELAPIFKLAPPPLPSE